MKPYRRVALYGGPGVGKSVLAAEVFACLKKAGLPVELASEWIKRWAWDKYQPTGWDRLTVAAKQIRTEERVLKAGGIVVTDSPPRLALAYEPPQWHDSTNAVRCAVASWEAEWPAVHLLVVRAVPYQQEGRWQTEPEARRVDARIVELLTGIDYFRVDPTKPDNVAAVLRALPRLLTP